VIDPKALKAFTQTLTDLRQAAGTLRDHDVMDAHLAGWPWPTALRPWRDALLQPRSALRESLANDLSLRLKSVARPGAVPMLGRVLEELAQRPEAAALERRLTENLTKRLHKARDKMAEVISKAVKKQTPEALHAVRIAVKKLRYGLELIEALGQIRITEELQFLKQMQSEIGVHHDVHIVQETLAQYALTHADQLTPAARQAYTNQQRLVQQRQARRAVRIMMQGYLWMNRYRMTAEVSPAHPRGAATKELA
jgi:CHAD domain-containing protein